MVMGVSADVNNLQFAIFGGELQAEKALTEIVFRMENGRG